MGDDRQATTEPEHRERTAVDLNEAVEIAKKWLTSTMAGEKISNLGLEEIEHRSGYWHITLGFSRPWDESRNAIAVLSGSVVLRRTFKVVTIDDATGEIISMKNRDTD